MLNQRLQACAAWITDGKTVCDVGTDHAYLAAELLRKDRCQRVIASDIGEGPLQAARRTLKQAGLLQRATLLLSDGLEQIDGTDISHVVIAGMGGETIIHILQPCDWVKQAVQLILQPMTKVSVLRQWLAENGYAILQEQIVKDGKFFYNLLRVEYDGVARTLTPLEREIGVQDWSDAVVQSYGRRKRERLQAIAEQIRNSNPTLAADDLQIVAELDRRLQPESV